VSLLRHPADWPHRGPESGQTDGKIGDFRASDRQKPRDVCRAARADVNGGDANRKNHNSLAVSELPYPAKGHFFSRPAIGTHVANRGRPVHTERR